MQPRGPSAKDIPGALAQQLSPAESQALPKSPSSTAIELGSDKLPRVLTPNFSANDSNSLQSSPQFLEASSYPRTPQAENSYEKLAPMANVPMTPHSDSFANSPMKKIPNQFANDPLTPANSGNHALAVKPSPNSFPETRSQQYTVQPSESRAAGDFGTPAAAIARPESKSFAAPGTQTAKLPASLNVISGYRPGSTGRVSTF